jgi:uncharacterized protein
MSEKHLPIPESIKRTGRFFWGGHRIEALMISLGLFFTGLFIYYGLEALSQRDRVVSVRGLAEREVNADNVIWPIIFKTTGNDLQAIYDEIDKTNKTIIAFLHKAGITDKEITIGAPKVIDLRAERYQDQSSVRERYNITSTITVSSTKVDTVRSLVGRTGELLKQGVAIAYDDYGSTSVQYSFNGLNAIKPAMIQEATRNARAAAEQFAKDSGSEVGKIKNATQGYFTVEDTDASTPHKKWVRVVTSVDYFLK